MKIRCDNLSLMSGTSLSLPCVTNNLTTVYIGGGMGGEAWAWKGPNCAWAIEIYVIMEFHFSWYLFSYHI